MTGFPPYRECAGPPVEWPTVAVAVVIYAGWLTATWLHAAMSTPLLIIVGGWIVAWQGSLQHETIHGHPTRIRRLNAAIGFPPLALWLPYAIYRRSHIAHHGSHAITDPRADPESRYVDRPRGLASVAATLQASLIGHMLFGPPITIGRFVIDEARRSARNPAEAIRDWLPHLLGAAVVIAWLDYVGLGLGRYILVFVYPGMALTALRAHAEHRADLTSRARAAIVEHRGMLALLFLNNNLHVAHHERPQLPWYRLPAYYRHHRARQIGEGAIVYAGYGDVVRRFALRAHDDIVHPGHRRDRQGS